MFATHTVSLFALNVAIASLLCCSLALIISACFGSLPKRYATLVVGLIACSLSPLVVGLGTAYSLGKLPAIVTTVNASDPLVSIPNEPTIEPVSSSSSVNAQVSLSPHFNEQLSEAPLVIDTPVSLIPKEDRPAAIVSSMTIDSLGKSSSLLPSIGVLLLCVWLFGSLMMLGAQLRKLVLCRRFLAVCQPVVDASVQSLFVEVSQRLNLRHSVSLLESEALPTPVVVALGRPAIILPADIQMSLSTDQLASVFAHELSHIARKDHWATAMQTLARILYWWNPLVHWASRRANELREMICDDIATSNHIAPKEYARTIVQMAERTAATRELVGSLGISLSPISELERRLRRIIARKSQAVDLRISKCFLIGLSTFSIAIITGLLFAQVPQAAEKALAATEQSPNTDPPTPEAKTEREVILRGQVTHPDGTPGTNMSVQVSGVGYEKSQCLKTTVTNLEGRYEFSVPPNQICALCVRDSIWTESELTGFAVTTQQTIQRDLRLRPVTRLHGQILDTVNSEAVPNQPITLTRRGIDWQAVAKASLPNPDNKRLWTYPIQVWESKSDKEGKYEFWVGDGDYQLTTSGEGGFQMAKVQGEKDVAVDTMVQMPLRLEIAGQVIDNATGQPVPGAKIISFPMNNVGSLRGRASGSLNEWSTLCDQDGRFKFKRIPKTHILQVTSPDNIKRALVQLKPDETNKEIRLGSGGSIHGRLMSEDGSAPAAGRQLLCGVRITDEETHGTTWRYGSDAETDEKGHFRFDNLSPGCEYEILYRSNFLPELPVSKVNILPARDLDLGDMPIPVSHRPYVPPTLDQRIDMAFDASGTSKGQFDYSTKLVKLSNQNLLVLFCQQSDIRARSFLATRLSSAFDPYRSDFRVIPIVTSEAAQEIAKRSDFRVIPIDTGTTQLEAAQEIAKRFDVDLSGGREAFHILLLNRAGSLIASLDASQLCDGDQFNKEKLFAVLDQNRIKPLNAQAVLDEGLLRATRENKKVLVQQTATWSNPSHSISLFLSMYPLWEKDYVWVQIDNRWTGSEQVLNRLKNGVESNAPWFAILDSSGKVLTTSSAAVANENLGFASVGHGLAHLSDMFRSTHVHMNDAELEHLAYSASRYRPMFWY